MGLVGLAVALGLGLPTTSAAPVRPGWAVVVDQESRSVFVLQSAEELMAYRRPDRLPVVWSWSADRAPDLAPAHSWSMPDEAKSRVRNGRRYLLTAASGGLVAAVDTATGRTYWAADTGGANPHSLELLPDGNVAVAASEGGWVRLYAASQGPRNTAHAAYPLPGAHGVHWDARTRQLWAVGTTRSPRSGWTARRPRRCSPPSAASRCRSGTGTTSRRCSPRRAGSG
ncbi:DUF6528 family protein [Kitasatospora sp. NPDC050463]|uniref:DUF6528 family protein n=1 Tax=Kitasatospora sp. NPDC050463 TaxID=3155786 RepID=UPI0033C8F1AA